MVAIEVVDHVVKHVLGVALKKSERAHQPNDRLYVGQFFTRIRGIPTTEDLTLDASDIEDVVRAAVFACILHNRSPLTLLGDAYLRCMDDRSTVHNGKSPYEVLRFKEAEKIETETQSRLLTLLESINQNVVSTASLLVVCPMFFCIEDLVAKEDLRKPPLDIHDQNVRCRIFSEVLLKRSNTQFTQAMMTQMWENDDAIAEQELCCVFEHMRLGVSHMPIGEKPMTELAALTNIATSKVAAPLLVSWLVNHDLGNIMWKASGVKREIWSLFGRILSSLPMTEEQLEASMLMKANNSLHDDAKSVRKMYFYGKRDIASLRLSLATLREDHESYIDQVATLLKNILRTDAKTREDMLSLLGRLISCNTSKRHMSRLTYIDQPPVTLDDNYRRRRLFIPDSTYGTSLNIMWLLLILSAGITEQKVESIDPNFCQLGLYIKHKMEKDAKEEVNSEEPIQNIREILDSMNTMLGFLSTSNAGMGDEKEILEALEEQKIDITATHNAKFITQIFWVTLYGLGMLYLPSLQEFLKIIMFTLQSAQLSTDPSNDQALMDVVSHVFTWKCVMQHAKFVESLWHYINISLMFFIRCALYSKDTEATVSKKHKLEGKAYCINLVDRYASGELQEDKVNPHFKVLPVEFIEIILDTVKNLAIMRFYVDHLKPEELNVLEYMNFDLVMATCIYIMTAPQSAIKNLTLKCDTVASIILNLSKSNGIKHFSQSSIAKRHLINGLTDTFILSQKADYNSRTSCRIHVIQTLTQLFDIEEYKASFVKNIIVIKEKFVQFMHLLLNDTTFIFEEVVSFLTEIRRREQEGITDEPREPAEQGGGSTSRRQGQDNEEQEDDPMVQEGAIDANQLKSMAFNELQGRTRTLVEYGSEITILLHTLCKEFNQEITSMAVLLPQVASCLGFCLESLAGENASRLKVKNMVQYNFQPKTWLSNVVKCYLALYGEDKNEHSEALMKAIVSEGRYFKPTNFERAFRIVTREMLLNSRVRRSFFNMSQKLFQYAKATNALYQNAMEAEIPEEFMDPIMMDIMEDPVLLPTSGMVMDRKNIERHLMSEANDPFSRQPLSKSDLVPQLELKNKIEEFMASLSQKGDSSDDIYQ